MANDRNSAQWLLVGLAIGVIGKVVLEAIAETNRKVGWQQGFREGYWVAQNETQRTVTGHEAKIQALERGDNLWANQVGELRHDVGEIKGGLKALPGLFQQEDYGASNNRHQ